MNEAYLEKEKIQLAEIILKSFSFITGNELFKHQHLSSEEKAIQLFNWENPVLAHNTNADPIFIYGNNKTLQQFEYTWEEFIKIPSRLSSEEINREERQKLLNKAHEKGYVTNYEGFRISKTGNRFYIKDVILWNLIDSNGTNHGQAAVIYSVQNQ